YGAETAKVPFSVINYDTTALTNGSHTVSAKGRDLNGAYIDAAAVTINVNNPVPLSIDSMGVTNITPTSATVTWTTSRPATFKVDYGPTYGYGNSVAASLLSSSQKVTLPRLGAKNMYYVRIQAWDQNYNNAVRTDLSFTTVESTGVQAVPKVTLVSSQTGNSVTGIVSLTAVPDSSLSSEGTGTAGLDGVQFLVDGSNIGERVMSAPYRAGFDTSSLPNGTHKFTVIVWDKFGKTGISDPVTVYVGNAATAAAATWVDSTSAKLINANGTFYLVSLGKRYGITDPGVLNSYGFEFKDAAAATASDTSLPQASLLAPGDGSIVKKTGDPTVWFVTGAKKYGFTSSDVFLGQGFAWGNVRTVSAEVLDSLTRAGNLSDANARHMAGVYITTAGTVYRMGQNTRLGIPSMEAYNSWNVDNDFSQVVPANAADLALPVGANLEIRNFR
ncbi:MAG: Ig-like domain-containing protein, partial [bacterium]|nr:Ig-like domain-containing protein [bacterium]